MRTLLSASRVDLSRFLRSPALLIIALLAPVAANYMIPHSSASYSVLTINDMKPELTPSVLGLKLGVLAATLVTPLAYIFLRSGPTRQQPWQIFDVAPHSRIQWVLGRWLADTLALWLLLLALTFAGICLGVFRLQGDVNLAHSVVALWLPAAPALALIAALRLVLASRSFSRGWVGDVLFFFIWMGLMLVSIIGTTDPQTGYMVNQPFVDAFGFTAPIIGAVNFDVQAVTIGGAANPSETVSADVWRAVTDPLYVLARLFWLGIAALLAGVAGLMWSPMGPAKLNKHAKSLPDDFDTKARLSAFEPNQLVVKEIKPPGAAKLVDLASKELRFTLSNRYVRGLLILAAVAGFFFPVRTIAAPAIWLALIFPLASSSARWERPSMTRLLGTIGSPISQQVLVRYISFVILGFAVALPTLIVSGINQNWDGLTHLIAIVLGVPAILLILARLTRSAVTGRLLMLMAWYGYFASGNL